MEFSALEKLQWSKSVDAFGRLAATMDRYARWHNRGDPKYKLVVRYEEGFLVVEHVSRGTIFNTGVTISVSSPIDAGRGLFPELYSTLMILQELHTYSHHLQAFVNTLGDFGKI
jgi:hypothetical protein